MSLVNRDMKPDDVAFVLDSWRRSFEGAPAVKGAERIHYRQEMTRAIRRILDRATVRVRCDANDEDTIVGFAAFTGLELHYVYVKKEFRKMGVAKAMLEGLPIEAYTFLTPSARPPSRWAFTPRFTL